MGSSLKSSSRMVMSEINVTPFVDVMLVLLVIFMVTAPMMQQGLEVNLPKTASSGVALSEDPFVLTIDSSGRLKAADIQINIADAREKIKAIFETRKNKQIYIQADRKVDYGVVAEVMGEIRAAGILNINLITLPKE
ncbi:MAG: biopolymer transporter ExbD [Bdellovibrio sp.]|nr:biopolymer transporter ExbD [Bdellovibrio sp.]